MTIRITAPIDELAKSSHSQCGDSEFEPRWGYTVRRNSANQSELPVVVVICARKDAIVLAGWNALLGQWIDWDTTDVLMRVRILHGVQ